jgi:hypothetical protein
MEQVMPGKRYKIIYSGKVVQGHDIEEVRKNLAGFFKHGGDKIEQLFSGKPVTVKKNTDYQSAMKYKMVFEKAGALCRVEEIKNECQLAQSNETEENKASRLNPLKTKNCPKCGFNQPDQKVECVNCGILFEKYREHQGPRPASDASEIEYEEQESVKEFLINMLLYVKPETNPLILCGRGIFFLMMLVWGLIFIFTPMETNYAGESFWHLVNLPFHEAGHIIFRPLGRFMASLGGSLGQLLMPLICLAVFLIKTKDTFAASFSLWWFGENFMDLAPYINDARSQTLPLLGGNTGRTSPYGFHDWEFLLNKTGLIRYDHILAHFSDKLGAILMFISFVWGGYILFKQYKNR